MVCDAGLVKLVWIVGQIGTAEVADINILMTFHITATLPAFGVTLASTTLVGNALGRDDIEDAAAWGWNCAALIGAGDTRRSMWISVIWQWLFFLPLAWLVGPGFGYGLIAVWLVNGVYRAGQSINCVTQWASRKWTYISNIKLSKKKCFSMHLLARILISLPLSKVCHDNRIYNFQAIIA